MGDADPGQSGSKRGRQQGTLLAIGLIALALGLWAALVPFPRQELAPAHVTSTLIVDRDGIMLREVLSDQEGRGRWLAYSEFSPHLIRATVHAEDKRFFDHPGVDGLALLRSSYTNLQHMEAVTGASTLTQQTVKLVHHRGVRRDLWTKISEAIWAIRLERTLTKEEILEQYLNRAPYGNQLHGAEAAARMYFSKSAAQLSIAEAALLAGLPQSPSRLEPYRHLSAAKERAHRILGTMFDRGALSEEQYRRAVAEPLVLRPRRAPLLAPHFTEHVLERTDGQARTGEVRTTVSVRTQAMVEGIVNAELSRLEDRNVSQGAVVVLDTQSAEVLAWVGSRDYWDRERQGANDGVVALRQPGSALKPFVYGLYIEEGGTAADMVADLPTQFPTGDGVYVPQNYSRRFSGPVSVRDALGSSLNLPAVTVASEVGIEKLLDRLKLAGLDSLELPPDHYGLGLALGDGEVRLVDLTAAYAALGRKGLWRRPSVLRSDPLAARPALVRIFDPEVAYILLDILSDDRARRLGFGEAGPLALPYKVAAKTGTSTDFRDNWAFGVTPDFTVGVWVGNFDGSPMNHVSGATGAAPVLRQVFQGLYPDAAGAGDVAWMPPPAGVRSHSVCALSGSPATAACNETRVELFTRGRQGAASARADGDLRDEGPELCPIHRSVAIDLRNGLLASDACPEAHVGHEVFEVVPGPWLEWAVQAGMKAPPTEVSPLCGAAAGSLVVEKIPAITITHPLPGDRFVIDPSVAAESQRVSLRAEVLGQARALTWFIDGERYREALAPYVVTWQLQPGPHRVGVGRNRLEAEVEISVGAEAKSW